MHSSEEHARREEPAAPPPPPRPGSGATNGNALLRHVRRVVTAVFGFTVLAIGIAMIVLPGPAIVVIPIGLGILAAEFTWAQRWLERIKEQRKKVLGV